MTPRPYRLFDVELIGKHLLSPNMARATFAGPEVRQMATGGPDQRIKVFFPNAAGARPTLQDRPDWYAAYKADSPVLRPPMRTYTIRNLRLDSGQVDVDFVLHGDGGPASRWARAARVGDRLQILAPNADFPGDPGGYEWKPPAALTDVLLIADETALPALAGILETLAARPSPPATQAFIEIPQAQDALTLPTWPSLGLTWMPRGSAGHGENMIDALSLAVLPVGGARPGALDAVDIDVALPWERATQGVDGFYAWVAGESAAVMAIRRELVAARGLDRRAINLMGYWREGRALE